MSKFCTNCGNQLDDNAVMCVKCGQSVSNQNVAINQKKKKGYGSYLGKTILVAFGIFLVCWIIKLILSLTGISSAKNTAFTFLQVGVPILCITFSPIIALILYLIKNNN